MQPPSLPAAPCQGAKAHGTALLWASLTPSPAPPESMSAVASGPTRGNCSLSGFSDFQEQLWPVLVLEFVVAVVGNGAVLHGLARLVQPWHADIILMCCLATGDLLFVQCFEDLGSDAS